MFKKIINLSRAVWKNKSSLATNIIGLSIGLATTILLVVFILHEWSYDRYFSRADDIYRLNSIWIDEGNSSFMPINLRQAFTEIPENVSGIESCVQIYRGNNVELRVDNSRFTQNKLLYVDSTFFNIFDLSLVEGRTKGALTNPGTVVLTKKLAEKLFGNTQVIGKVIIIGEKNYSVSAVVEDVPVNTHFSFDLLLPMSSLDYLSQLGGLEFFTYYLINKNADSETVTAEICNANTQMLKNKFKSFNYNFSSEIEPLKRLHLYSKSSYDLGRQGSVNTVIIVGIIAFLVMFLALTNFVNLFIIEGEQRAKEIGVRKVNGAGKANLIAQFFGETSFIVGIAFILGTVLAVLLLPWFGQLMQRQFSMHLFESPILILSWITVLIITIVLAGSYPSLYLSRFNPSTILKSQPGKRNRKKYVMNLAGGVQLVITLFLITFLFGINKQTNYLKNLSPGFNPNGLVNIFNLNDNIKQHYPSIRDQLLRMPEIKGVAASSHTVGGGTSGQGIRLIEAPAENVMSINEYRIQPGLCQLLELNLKEGRFFDPERAADKNGVILNEAAVHALGLSSAVGRQVVMFKEPMEIIGVVKDFRYQSAAKIIQPLVMTAYSDDMWNIMVRMDEHADYQGTLNKIQAVFRSFDDGYVISSGKTADIYRNYYVDEDRLSQLTRMGTALAVVIVMMGIFMLVSQSIARRTKEIGVRKVLGGSTFKMLALIYSNSLRWTLTAAVIAIPLSFFVLQNWLKSYAVKVDLGWWLFAEGILIILVLETLITFVQTWRAASRNPVESLRYE